MIKNFWQNKLIVTLTLIVVMLLLLISACNLIDLSGGETPTISAQPAILSPLENVKVLVNAPVQFQSIQPAANISRVELLVQGPNSTTETLVRADKPTNGVVLQQWTPQQPGQYIVKVRTFDINNVIISELPRTIEVVSNEAISLAVAAMPTPLPNPPVQPTAVLATPAPAVANPAGGEFQASEVAVIQVVATATATPSPTPIPRYPPPPPAPGVPPGPVQSPALNVHPPVCDAAEYLGPYIPPTVRDRIFISEEDDVAAKAVGDTKVSRAWRLRNTGTCTWGPGYELAFYGGRSMGSGGVSFESFFFGQEPDRRNIVESSDKLIGAEGKPNQVAIAEVFLNVPTIPGIHQSYWRMRNPQGVYFGPIIGVTMDVIRDCEPASYAKKIYGAPLIQKFEVLAAGKVYKPINPIEVTAKLGEAVTLDWEVISADHYDVVVREPTGSGYNLATRNLSDRKTFIPDQLGDYVITLYADNGACAGVFTGQVTLHIIPNPESDDFELNIILGAGSAATSSRANTAQVTSSADVAASDIVAEWSHPDVDADKFVLRTQLVKVTGQPQCTSSITQCNDWPAALQSFCQSLFCSSDKGTVITTVDKNVGSDFQGSATVANTLNLCRQANGDSNAQYILRFQMFAGKNGATADPVESNKVEINCPARSSAVPLLYEIQPTVPIPVATPNP